MTLKELSQIPYLEEEIKLYHEEINSLMENKCTDYESKVQHLQSQIEKRSQEFNLLNEYIENIPDSRLRNIIKLKCIKGLSWVQISFRVRGYSADNARKAVKRFLDKN